jgi:glycosyltransferase involved in cell wall biosynthesis
VYHNITPAEFFEPYQPALARMVEQGRADLQKLSGSFSHSAGVSAYNVAELVAYGFQDPQILPIVVDPTKWNIRADEDLMRQLQDGLANILFVGRIAPNKRQDHLVEAFAHYLTLDDNARLILAGNYRGDDPYYHHVMNYIEKLNLASRVIITGLITDQQLSAYYRAAWLLWSMSEHEGFCVPMAEAMWFDVPILAYKSTAVPETLGEAGLLFTKKDNLLQVAALAKLLIRDENLRAKMCAAQRKRREAFLPEAVWRKFETVIDRMEKGL